MKLQIKNLGPIKNGEIDLTKRFYVFVGYNNSGKTYVSQLLWTMLNGLYLQKFISKSSILRIIETSKTEIELTEEMFNNILTEYSNYIQTEAFAEVLGLSNGANKILENCKIKFIDKDYNKFVKGHFSADSKNYFQGKLFLQFNSNVLEGSNKIKVDTNIIDISKINEDTKLENQKIYFLKYTIIRFILESQLGLAQPFFLPAERLFLAKFWDLINYSSNYRLELLHDISNLSGLTPEKSNQYFKTLSSNPYSYAFQQGVDSFRKLELGDFENTSIKYKELLNDLELILGGELKNDLNKIENIMSKLEFSLKLNGNDISIPIKHTSSSVNQLSALYLYLKFWTFGKYDFLILDEPEQNLHPKNQIALLDILMKFANRNNNRVLITTHSSILADAVNNHLNLGTLKKAGIDIEKIIDDNNLNIDVESALDSDETGIYFFDGKKIIEYSVEEYGVFFRDFKRAENEVNRTNEILTNSIFDQLEKEEETDEN